MVCCSVRGAVLFTCPMISENYGKKSSQNERSKHIFPHKRWRCHQRQNACITPLRIISAKFKNNNEWGSVSTAESTRWNSRKATSDFCQIRSHFDGLIRQQQRGGLCRRPSGKEPSYTRSKAGLHSLIDCYMLACNEWVRECLRGCGAWQQRGALQQPLIVSRLFIMDGRQSGRQTSFSTDPPRPLNGSQDVEKHGHEMFLLLCVWMQFVCHVSYICEI